MKSLDYLKKIRKDNCCICGSKAEPHHMKEIGMGRNRQLERAEHFTALAMCRGHHSELHTIGLISFQVKYNINLWREVAYQLVEVLWESQNGSE